jgi:predicted transglutaminase-like cysteine proteinase
MRQAPTRWRIAALFVFAAISFSQFLFASAVQAHSSAAAVFGTREVFSSDTKFFTKWNGVIARTDAQREEERRVCGPSYQEVNCPINEWRAFIAELRDLPERERIERANDILNRIPYVSADTNWHDPNHWETPFEFLTRGGQCQDYAIAKFLLLAASGIPSDHLRLVIVHDREKNLDHAVTVAFVGDDALVLDNQITDVSEASKTRRYTPYYSINLTGWWLHLPRYGTVADVRPINNGVVR